MSKLTILRYPDPRLHTIAKPVAQVDDRIRALIRDMFETMYDANGVGLAATQVDVHERVIVIDVSEDRDDPLGLINPKALWTSEEKVVNEEGCLSVPSIYDVVERPERIRVQALNEQGELQEIEGDGLLSRCIQHEMDHLMGKVFVEYLSNLKRTRIKTRLIKAEREAAKL